MHVVSVAFARPKAVLDSETVQYIYQFRNDPKIIKKLDRMIL